MSTPIQNGKYQVFPSYAGTDLGPAVTMLLPPAFDATDAFVMPPIPLMYSGTGDFTSVTGSNGDFSFSMSSIGVPPTPANVQLNVTISGKNMWGTLPETRAALIADFTSTLLAIETFELQGILIPGATLRIGQWIADFIAAPLAETAFYRYSLSNGFGTQVPVYVDVRPGMNLRVDAESSQYLGPDSEVNGYVAGASLALDVVSVPAAAGTRAVAFDPFLGAIASPAITDGATDPLVAAGAIDLQAALPQPWWRLFYPESIPAPSQPGDQELADNVALIGAPSLAQMAAITASYPNLPPNSGVAFVFSGRTIAVPQIPIRITAVGQSFLEYVPIGTTIANVVERFQPLPLQAVPSPVSVLRTAASGNTNKLTWEVEDLLTLPSGMFDVPLQALDNVTLDV